MSWTKRANSVYEVTFKIQFNTPERATDNLDIVTEALARLNAIGDIDVYRLGYATVQKVNETN